MAMVTDVVRVCKDFRNAPIFSRLHRFTSFATDRRFGSLHFRQSRLEPKSLRFEVTSHRSRCLKVANAMSFTTQVSPSDEHAGKMPENFFRSVLASMEKIYLSKNQTARSILDLVQAYDGGRICYDHFAFRTFNVDGCGISAMAQVFLDFGYIACGELRFPGKHLKALWFSPPRHLLDCDGGGVNGPLPRVFISELLVEELSSEAQKIIKKYTSVGQHGNRHAALASILGSLTWPTPSLIDYQRLARESEYAAWTLVNGYALNHLTISVHRLKSEISKLPKLNDFLQAKNINFNTEGGILKVSPDGQLIQSSTVADSMIFHFTEGNSESVPASYIEFAERLVLPEFKQLSSDQIFEWHRRDGFEVGNADKIFESTSTEQLLQKMA